MLNLKINSLPLRFFLILIFLLMGCRGESDKKPEPVSTPDTTSVAKEEPRSVKPKLKSLEGIPDTTFVRLEDYSADFAYDMRYATENNFLEAKVYDCAECYTRVKTVKALIEANREFRDLGYRIRFFDCYRPNSVQYKMWEIVPNPQYVANPVKGSIHNKGGAVDITLETLQGEVLDMGTDFDFFGRRAYHDFTELPENVLANRKILKDVMEKHGFWSIRSEWWHYNLTAASNDPVANFKWPCPVKDSLENN